MIINKEKQSVLSDFQQLFFLLEFSANSCL